MWAEQVASGAMRCVVVGGGIAGVCCAEELCRLRPEFDVVLVSEDRTLKVHSAQCDKPSSQ